MDNVLQINPREAGKKSVLRNLRKEGKVPAVVYGADMTPQAVWVGKKPLKEILKHSRTSVINLASGEKHIRAIIKDAAYDTLTDEIIHVDFMKVVAKKEIELTVPVEIAGECPGVKAGGILDFIVREVDIKTIPSKIPESLKIDVSGLEIGHFLKVSDIEVPDGVRVLTDSDTICVNVKAPKAEAPAEEEAAEAAEEQPEPEVAKKGKESKEIEEKESSPVEKK
ncbi:MAG: 50S ribosomal protein L25 [Elusimicrobia bacterium]|nr:50S ribosomal protein L25 [Elusimicrobiota bacterium]